MANIKLCKTCREKMSGIGYGYATWLENRTTCNVCGTELIEIDLSEEDYRAIRKISQDVNFVESMIELKQKDPIEYQLKMSQFRAANAQQAANTTSSNQLRCPTCKSTNVHRITGTERAVSVLGLGILSKKINKSFKCNKCGYTW